MPPGRTHYRLRRPFDLLRAMFVIDENRAVVAETSALVHDSSVHVVLPTGVRRIRVVLNDTTLGTKAWFCSVSYTHLRAHET